jgi:hypothetical protein
MLEVIIPRLFGVCRLVIGWGAGGSSGLDDLAFFGGVDALDDDAAFSHQGGDGADSGEYRGKGEGGYADYTDGKGHFDEGSSLFALDDEAADVAFGDKLFDTLKQVFAVDAEFFAAGV